MITRGETDVDIQLFAECSPYLGCELGASVTDNILRDSIVPEHVVEHSLCSLHGCGESFQGDQPAGLGEPVYDNEDCRETTGQR